MVACSVASVSAWFQSKERLSPGKWMSNLTKLHLTHENFQKFYQYNHNSYEICLLFSRTSKRNFLWCYYRWFIISLALENVKKKKKCNILYIILVQGFCPLKIQITHVPVDSVLIYPGTSIAKTKHSYKLRRSIRRLYSHASYLNW